jgi:hypothetical protein
MDDKAEQQREECCTSSKRSGADVPKDKSALNLNGLKQMDILALEKQAKQTGASTNQRSRSRTRSNFESPDAAQSPGSVYSRGSFFKRKPTQIDPFNVYGKVMR